MSNCITTTIRPIKRYKFTPLPDITAYELALVLPALLSQGTWDVEDYLSRQPANVKRHFEEMP